MIAEQISKIIVSWATLITIIVSLAIGFWQFKQLRQEQTVSRVFDMSKEYRASFLDVNLKFSDEWTDYYQTSIRTLSDAEVLKQYPARVKAFLEKAKPETRTRYETLVFFYNSLGECVRATLCDFDSANAIFGDDLLTFYDNMYPDLQSVCKHGYEADGIFYFIAERKKKPTQCLRDTPSLPTTHAAS